MSCIDSAIIKALVEHIGMNPDDVGSSGAGSDVFDTTKYTKRDILTVEDDGLYINTTNTDPAVKLGDIFVVDSTTNGKIAYGFVSSISKYRITISLYSSVDKTYSLFNFEYNYRGAYVDTTFKTSSLTQMNATVALYESGISLTHPTFIEYYIQSLATQLRDYDNKIASLENNVENLKNAQ